MRDDGWLLKSLNSNPSVSLDKLLKQTTTALAPMVFEPSDTVYFEIPNEAKTITTSNFGNGKNNVEHLNYKVKFNLGGVLILKFDMYYTIPDYAQNGGTPTLEIYKNDILYKSINSIHSTKFETMSVNIDIDKDDILSFALNGGIEKKPNGVLCRNTLYLQANSMKIYGEAVNQKYTDGIEVSDQ